VHVPLRSRGCSSSRHPSPPPRIPHDTPPRPVFGVVLGFFSLYSVLPPFPESTLLTLSGVRIGQWGFGLYRVRWLFFFVFFPLFPSCPLCLNLCTLPFRSPRPYFFLCSVVAPGYIILRSSGDLGLVSPRFFSEILLPLFTLLLPFFSPWSIFLDTRYFPFWRDLCWTFLDFDWYCSCVVNIA